MNVRLSMMLGLVLACAAGVAAQPATRPALPERLRPFAELAQRCARYEVLATGSDWRVIHQEGFARGSDGWRVVAPEMLQGAIMIRPGVAGPSIASLAKEDGRDVLVFDVHNHEQGLLAIGPKVSGDFAVEMVARIVSERVCDLSLVCDAVSIAPGFQFGGYDNTRNILWVGSPKDREQPEGAGNTAVDVGGGVAIERGRWHRVRMEVKGNEIIGSVDGKQLGKANLGPDYDRQKKRQPMIYTYNSTVQVDEFTVWAHAPAAHRLDPKDAWPEAFGKLTREQVVEQIGQLVDLLEDDDWVVREGAEELLREIGPMARESLERAVREGGAEQAQRANRILRDLRSGRTASPATRESTPGPKKAP